MIKFTMVLVAFLLSYWWAYRVHQKAFAVTPATVKSAAPVLWLLAYSVVLPYVFAMIWPPSVLVCTGVIAGCVGGASASFTARSIGALFNKRTTALP
jgi:hypothetical protein